MRTMGAPLDRCHLIGWRNIAAFARHMRGDRGSCVWRAEHADEYGYRDGYQTNAQLADLYDQLAAFAHMFASAHSNRAVPKPKPYPRPWANGDSERIGRGAIPISKFESWYYGGE